MAFFEPSSKDDAVEYVKTVTKKRKGQRADWGLSLDKDSVNTRTVWNSFQDARIYLLNEVKPSSFQIPLLPAIEYSFNFGTEPFGQCIYAIDGGDQIALEFADGSREGVGLVKYAWVAMQDGKLIDSLSQRREPQFVPADIADLYKFSLLNFNKAPDLNPDTLLIRNYAALRRTQLEFLVLNELIDYAEPNEIILLDGFLKAMFTPPIDFIHQIGKKAARKGVIILGVAKSSKIAELMWLHFKEYWACRQTQSGWIRPPAVITDKAYPSMGEDTNQFLYLGEKGRGIGFPIAATFNAVSRDFYIVDFNIYNFEAAKSYLNTMELPEIQAKYFPLSMRDKEFISRVLAQIAYYSEQITCLGYPFPTAKAHNLARISRIEVNAARSMLMPPFLSNGIPIKDLVNFQDIPHKMLENF